jgi:hypothetical protein
MWSWRRRISPAFSFIQGSDFRDAYLPSCCDRLQNPMLGVPPSCRRFSKLPTRSTASPTTHSSTKSPRHPSLTRLHMKNFPRELKLIAGRHRDFGSFFRRVNVNFQLTAPVNVHALFSQIEIPYSINQNRPFVLLLQHFCGTKVKHG